MGKKGKIEELEEKIGNIEFAIRELKLGNEQIAATARWDSTFPSPDELKAYDTAVEGTGGVMLKVWEGQAHHRQRIQARGIIFAFIVACLGILGLVFAFTAGEAIFGFIGLGGAAFMVRYFIYGTRSRQQ
jgi:uncharacterized membrane protein